MQDTKSLPALPSAGSADGTKLVLGQKLSLEGLGPAIGATFPVLIHFGTHVPVTRLCSSTP